MVADRIGTGLAVLALLTGCGGGAPIQSPNVGTQTGATQSSTSTSRSDQPEPNPPQPLVLTDADDGRTISVSVTAVVIVRLTTASGASWESLRADGPGVVVSIDYRTDPGYREWEVRLSGSGTVILESTCSGPGCERSRFRVSLVA